jgi:hypothetical protein|tara:strand:- start:2087 stop:2626 length:540 start_codon:yes stop_codon:yes gene_type:complete
MANETLRKAITLINTKHTHVLEFGVYSGGTLKQLRKELPPKFQTFGFDSWEGLPEDWVGTRHKKGGLYSNMPHIENTKLYKGWFTDTIPKYKEIAEPITLLHCDADLYSSTITILYELNEYIVPETVIVFDEWYYNHKDVEENRQHEQKAFYEWVSDMGREYILYDEVEDERKIIKITK